MAGSRTEKFGSIYTRMCGLLRSGALKVEDRPVWFDVFEAFPPKTVPVYEQKVPRKKVQNILKFYQTFGNPDIVDLSNNRVKTTCQKFVEKYLELQKSSTPNESIFEATTTAIKQQGIRLRSLEEIKKMKAEYGEVKQIPTTRISVKEVFGDVKTDDDEVSFAEEDNTSDPYKGS